MPVEFLGPQPVEQPALVLGSAGVVTGDGAQLGSQLPMGDELLKPTEAVESEQAGDACVLPVVLLAAQSIPTDSIGTSCSRRRGDGRRGAVLMDQSSRDDTLVASGLQDRSLRMPSHVSPQGTSSESIPRGRSLERRVEPSARLWTVRRGCPRSCGGGAPLWAGPWSRWRRRPRSWWACCR
jgi:hypothetical protein